MIKRMTTLSALLLLLAGPLLAFTKDGCGSGKCSDCHSLDLKEASKLLERGVEKVHRVDFAEIPGMWVVEAEKDGQRFPIYVDFSKSYVLAGNVIRLKDGVNITQQKLAQMGGAPAAPGKAVPAPAAPAKVDLARVPLDDALLLGKASAKKKVVVFTDPLCPYCKKLHEELKEVVRLDPEIAFQIKLFPLKMHPEAYGIAKSILCTNSLALLEASFAGAPVPPPLCQDNKVDASIAAGESIGIRSTPTLILPDGTLLPGYKKAADLLKLLGSKVVPSKAG